MKKLIRRLSGRREVEVELKKEGPRTFIVIGYPYTYWSIGAAHEAGWLEHYVTGSYSASTGPYEQIPDVFTLRRNDMWVEGWMPMVDFHDWDSKEGHLNVELAEELKARALDGAILVCDMKGKGENRFCRALLEVLDILKAKNVPVVVLAHMMETGGGEYEGQDRVQFVPCNLRDYRSPAPDCAFRLLWSLSSMTVTKRSFKYPLDKLCTFSKVGDVKKLRSALESGEAQIPQYLVVQEATSPLVIASAQGHFDCVELLLAHKCDDSFRVCGASALEAALRAQHGNIATLLLDRRIQDLESIPLAELPGSMLKLCLDRHSLSADALGDLCCSLSKQDAHEKLALICSEDWASIEPDRLRSSICFAARFGGTKTLQFLISRGVDCNSSVWDGVDGAVNMTPLIWASLFGHSSAVAFLLSVPEVDVNQGCGGSKFSNALSAAVDRGRCDIARLLLEDRRVRIESQSKSPLRVALLKRDYEMARILLSSGADPHELWYHNAGPFEHCIKENDLVGLKLLLAHGFGFYNRYEFLVSSLVSLKGSADALKTILEVIPAWSACRPENLIQRAEKVSPTLAQVILDWSKGPTLQGLCILQWVLQHPPMYVPGDTPKRRRCNGQLKDLDAVPMHLRSSMQSLHNLTNEKSQAQFTALRNFHTW